MLFKRKKRVLFPPALGTWREYVTDIASINDFFLKKKQTSSLCTLRMRHVRVVFTPPNVTFVILRNGPNSHVT